MSIARQIEMYLGIALLLVIAVLGTLVWVGQKRVETVSEQRNVASGDASAYKVEATEAKRIAKKEVAAHAAMDEALGRSPDWADEPVPDDVARLLCHSPDAACALPASDADH